jgi:hypothetical protein
MLTPQGVTMSPKSSVPQAACFVSQVSMSDNSRVGGKFHQAPFGGETRRKGLSFVGANKSARSAETPRL